MFQIKRVLNFWKVKTNFWNTLYSEITEQLQILSPNFGEFTLSFVKINAAYIHVSIVSK